MPVALQLQLVLFSSSLRRGWSSTLAALVCKASPLFTALLHRPLISTVEVPMSRNPKPEPSGKLHKTRITAGNGSRFPTVYVPAVIFTITVIIMCLSGHGYCFLCCLNISVLIISIVIGCYCCLLFPLLFMFWLFFL